MARIATDDEAEVFHELRSVIAARNARNSLRTKYAEADKTLGAYSLRLPNGVLIEQTPLHWPAKAIEVFSSRLSPEFYSLPGSRELLNDLEAVYSDPDYSIEWAEQLAIRAALRHGPSFVFTSRGREGEQDVVVTPKSALSASCLIDPRTRRVTAALEILDGRTSNLYLPGRTLYVQHGVSRVVVLDEFTAPDRVMCAPFIHDATLDRPFGSSRITRPVMGFTDAGVRTFMRQESSAEHYAAPREKWLGVSRESFPKDEPGWTREIGDIDMMPDVHPDDDDAVPDELRRAEVKWAPQMTMQPFSDQFRLIASQFSGASSIPLSYLGIVQDSNPTSSEAIEAQDVDLVRAVRDQYPSFNHGRATLARNILTLLREEPIDPKALRGLTPRWANPRVQSVSEQSQFVALQVQTGNFQPGTRETLELLPINADEVRAHADANRLASNRRAVAERVARAREAAAAQAVEAPTTDEA